MLWSPAMHTHKLAFLLAFALVAPAAAEIPYSCQGGTVKRMSIASTRKVLRIDKFIPAGLDPVTNGPIPTPPTTNVPPTNYGAHGGMRLLDAIQAQIDQFLRTGGDVQNFCSGACDPE